MPSPLEEQIGVTFRDGRLLQSAFIHRSIFNERPERVVGLTSNERLEFLGDAVLNFTTADWLFARFPERSEGELTNMRAALVRTATLADFARGLGLGRLVRISRGEDTPAARDRPALLADLFESLVGAIYLDQGLPAARAFIEPFLAGRIAAVLSGAEIDPRTRLQELAQARHARTPAYRTVAASGPDHEREFTVEVLVGERVVGSGSGRSKQAAAHAAAVAGLAALEAEG